MAQSSVRPALLGILLVHGRIGKALAGFAHPLAESLGNGQADPLPLGDLVAHLVQLAAGQFHCQVVRPFALAERGRADHQLAVAFDFPGNEERARVIDCTLNDHILARPERAARPGHAVVARKAGALSTFFVHAVGFVNRKSHQAHGLRILSLSGRLTDGNVPLVQSDTA